MSGTSTPEPNINIDLAYAIIERDIAQYRKERYDKLILELQSKSKLIKEKPTDPKPSPTVKEITFTILTYEPQQGTKAAHMKQQPNQQKTVGLGSMPTTF